MRAQGEHCDTMMTHSDLSIHDTKFPKDSVLVTQLREPVGRILSSYEMAVEVGAGTGRERVLANT